MTKKRKKKTKVFICGTCGEEIKFTRKNRNFILNRHRKYDNIRIYGKHTPFSKS